MMGIFNVQDVLRDPSSNLPLIVLLLTLVVLVVRIQMKRQRLPPGPANLPVIGSAHRLPKEQEWLVYHEWSSRYGSDVLYYESWGRPHIIVNSHEAAAELFEKRSSLYSDRPRMPMLNELVGFEWDFAFMPYAEEWKDTRKAFMQHFRQGTVAKYRHVEIRRTRELLLQLLETPDEFMNHIRLMAGKIIMDIAYGIDVKHASDPYISTAQKALYAMNVTGNVGAYLVDHIPTLKYIPEWLPGATFKKRARHWRVHVDAMVSAPAQAVQSGLANGSASQSMLASLLEAAGNNLDPYKVKVMHNAAATAYEGGSETTMSALMTLVLAMVMHPDIQRRAQKEIDAVVGSDRLPEFSDQASMPYLAAICKEVLRWRPVLPLGIMRRVTSDDTYRGYYIPGGATVVVNTWAILHDETVYRDADKFNPERFLTESGQLDPDASEPAASFGYGRRICPGMYMASDSLWITAAYLVWALNIEKPMDQHGQVIEPTGEYTFGLVSYPAPFKCAFKLRSQKILDLIRAANDSL